MLPAVMSAFIARRALTGSASQVAYAASPRATARVTSHARSACGHGCTVEQSKWGAVFSGASMRSRSSERRTPSGRVTLNRSMCTRTTAGLASIAVICSSRWRRQRMVSSEHADTSLTIVMPAVARALVWECGETS